MEWKTVSEFPDYEVNTNGVIRKAGLEFGWKDNGRGYKCFSFWKDRKYFNRYIHRVVATAFIPNELGKAEVNHKDGNKSNNCVSNLEWVSRSENHKHRFSVLGHKPTGCFVKGWTAV